MKRISLLLAIIFILIGCSSAYDGHMEEAEKALESGDFETALTSYNAALEEETDSAVAKDMIALLTNYEKVQDKMGQYEWTEAHDLANDLLQDGDVPSSLQTAVKKLVTTIETEIENEEKITSELKNIEKQIDNEQIAEAQKQLSKLDEDIKSPTLTDKVDTLHKKVTKVEKQIAEKERKEKAAEEKRIAKEKQAEEKRLAEEQERAEKAKGSKDTYFEKAFAIQDRMIAEKEKHYGNSTAPSGFNMQYDTDWTDLLNEVYSTLEVIMPADEFKELAAEHQNWQERKAALLDEYPDEPASNRTAASDLAVELNMDRTLYLIGNFME